MTKSGRFDDRESSAVRAADSGSLRSTGDLQESGGGGPSSAEVVVGEQLLEAFASSPTHAVVTTTLDGVTLRWSAGAELMLGYSDQEIVGRNLRLLLPGLEDTLIGLPERLQKAGSHELELELRRKDGSPVEVAVMACLHVSNGATAPEMLLLMRDISHSMALERRLNALARLETLAAVAAGFAHDLNNVLTIVATYQSFVTEGPLSREQTRDLAVARAAVQRGASLIDHLVTVSYHRQTPASILNLNEVVAGVHEMLHKVMLRADIDLRVTTAPQRVEVRSSPGQLHQVLMNLVLNARDAIAGAGAVSISVVRVVCEAGHPWLGDLPPAAYAALVVVDTGVGMDPATRARIFEPFFTTKGIERGTGLGLMIVKDIVSRLGGAITVESALGKGSKFRVLLPLVSTAP